MCFYFGVNSEVNVMFRDKQGFFFPTSEVTTVKCYQPEPTTRGAGRETRRQIKVCKTWKQKQTDVSRRTNGNDDERTRVVKTRRRRKKEEELNINKTVSRSRCQPAGSRLVLWFNGTRNKICHNSNTANYVPQNQKNNNNPPFRYLKHT
ncbi:hypothetical protein F2P81_000136 [Scophthalmus maximus]|uniref:Uncharacterized protein n=1 Tax=Scophthalmus maximus TaxID=52904 RepID=A0A6A4TKB8_SCOMX|nr:hypothetical protein F2P81_000136 [Scophthalmus maximus]